MSCDTPIEVEVKEEKGSKTLRYYYRHREEILEKKRQKRLEDPEYAARAKAREEGKRKREEERRAREAARVEKASKLGVEIASGTNKKE